MKLKEYDKKVFIEVCERSSSMARAAAELGIHFNTFRRHAIKLGCYRTNPSGKGLPKNQPEIFKLEDILDGKYPHFGTFKLKRNYLRLELKKINVKYVD